MALGTIGEKLVQEYVINIFNFKVIATNYKCRNLGEIDIVAKLNNKYFFIEVKTRENSDYMNIYEQVNKRKMQAMLRAANYYILANKLNSEYRIDLATVDIKNKKVEYFENIITP